MPVAQNFTRFQALPGNADPEARPPIYSFTRSQALPAGNAYPEAQQPILMESLRGRARVKWVPRLLLGTY